MLVLERACTGDWTAAATSSTMAAAEAIREASFMASPCRELERVNGAECTVASHIRQSRLACRKYIATAKISSYICGRRQSLRRAVTAGHLRRLLPGAKPCPETARARDLVAQRRTLDAQPVALGQAKHRHRRVDVQELRETLVARLTIQPSGTALV